MDPAPKSAPQRRLLTVAQWNDHHSWPSPAGLRHLIFYASQNGFESVIRRAGRRVLIDEAAFFAWMDSAHRPAPPEQASPKRKKA